MFNFNNLSVASNLVYCRIHKIRIYDSFWPFGTASLPCCGLLLQVVVMFQQNSLIMRQLIGSKKRLCPIDTRLDPK